MAYTHVAHDCQLGDYVIMANVATLAGHVTVHDHASIGGLVAIHQFCRIGPYSYIGGMSGISKDVPHRRHVGYQQGCPALYAYCRNQK